MLLTGPPKDINFQYFTLRRTSLLHAPYLLANNSPLLLLVLSLQHSFAVKNLLESVGVIFTDDMATVSAKLLADLKEQHDGMGFTQAFEELCKVLKGR
jgi:hypothetical protein